MVRVGDYAQAVEELAARFTEFMRPSATDVRRAKRAVMRLLDDGRVHRTPALAMAAAEELGSPRDLAQLKVEFLGQPDPDRIGRDGEVVAFVRARYAGRWAVAELAAIALVIPVLDPGGGDEPSHDRFAEGPVIVDVQHPHGGDGARVDLPGPALAPAYIRSPITDSEPRWYLDPDVFSEELDDLELDDRARRALREALSAFRRGLYLASSALLGVVSEAAWYQAAELLGKPGPLEKAIHDERTAKVQELVAAHLREKNAGSATMPAELLANAALLRELRNYGVHPAKTRDDLERYFNEEECGLLILRTHNYLVRLASAVRQAIAKGV